MNKILLWHLNQLNTSTGEKCYLCS